MSGKLFSNGIQIVIHLVLLFIFIGCAGQTPNMARMIFPESEIGGTISKSGKVNNQASYDAVLNTYEFGIYGGTLPRFGMELGSSGLTGRIGIASRSMLGVNAWANYGVVWSKEITGGMAISEKFDLSNKWAIGTYQFLSHSSDYPLYEDRLVESVETVNEVGLGFLLRTMQCHSAIYSLEGKVSRQIDENTYRLTIAASFSLNKRALK